MSQIYTFHKTVIGHSHVTRGIPCEDASASFTAEDGRYHIALIADGHGQERSFRSSVGSRFAAEAALEALKAFAEAVLSSKDNENQFYLDILENPRYRRMAIRQLTDTIFTSWYDRVREDFSANPPSPEEQVKYAAYCSNEEEIPKIYGTTLIAALRLPKCMVLLQQGDGRCDVFYADGSVDQPIPWDDRCEGNVTTSLCDEDAFTSVRHCVLDLEQKPVVACYAGSDGVEDAYRTMDGTHTFYRDLSCILAEKHGPDFDAYLEEMLPEFSAWGRFSKAGSGDDVSVAGIVDLDGIAPLLEGFRTAVQRFELEEDLFWQEDALRSKMRKHSILKQRMEAARAEYEAEEARRTKISQTLATMYQKREELTTKLASSQHKVCEGKEDLDAISRYLESTLQEDTSKNLLCKILAKNPKLCQLLLNSLGSIVSNDESSCSQMQTQCDELTRRIADLSDALEKPGEALARYEQAKAAFEEYDGPYQAISEQIRQLKDQIWELR